MAEEQNLFAPDNRELKSEQFRRTLNQIQERTVNPETIDRYASSSLADLIRLTDSVLGDYCTERRSDPFYGK